MIADYLIQTIDWGWTAYCLSGHPCRVYFRQPARRGLKALHYRVGDHSVIELDPLRLTDDDLMPYFLHEVAHSRLHFNNLKVHQSERQPQSAPAYSKIYEQSAIAQKKENEANRLMNEWLHYARFQDTIAGKCAVLRLYYIDD